ncbi:MAG: ribosome maturation factor RimP [Eubacterium sp.]|nr:ribosome maturation factor RimP [Eubacterium sp.]
MSHKTETIEKRAEELILPVLEERSFELYDLEFVKEAGTWYLRAYIDKEGGITVDDCETVSRAFEKELDEEDLIEEAYILEVSSPGLGRQLKKQRHFEKAVGEVVEVHTYRPVDGEKLFIGELLSFDPESVTIREEEAERTFSKQDISVVRLYIDF